MALRRGGTSMSWLAESLADRDDQTSDGWCWLRQNAAAERSSFSTCHHVFKWNIRHTSTLLMECADQMELFSVASWIYLFIREGDCVKKMTKVSTICCQSCTFASKLQLFCYKTHLHVKKKKLQKFAASSIFFKSKSNWLKTPIKSQHKQDMWAVRNSICSHFHVSTWLNNTKQIPVWYFDMKLSSIVLWWKWGKSNAGNRLQGFHLNSYMKYE